MERSLWNPYQMLRADPLQSCVSAAWIEVWRLKLWRSVLIVRSCSAPDTPRFVTLLPYLLYNTAILKLSPSVGPRVWRYWLIDFSLTLTCSWVTRRCQQTSMRDNMQRKRVETAADTSTLWSQWPVQSVCRHSVRNVCLTQGSARTVSLFVCV